MTFKAFRNCMLRSNTAATVQTPCSEGLEGIFFAVVAGQNLERHFPGVYAYQFSAVYRIR